MFSITSRSLGGVTVLDLSGRLSSGESIASFLDEARRAGGEGKGCLLINLEEVPYIDSLGLESLIEVYNRVRSRHGEVGFLNPSRKVAELLSLTKLTSVFEIFVDEATAIASLEDSAGSSTD